MSDTAANPYTAALEATNRGLQREIARLRADLEDQRGLARGFRRLFIEALRRCKGCERCEGQGRQDSS